jgi:cell division protein ZipA
MREWLTVIIALLILAVVLDGLRRMRQARRSGIRMSRGKRPTSVPGRGDEYGSELPNGGARVVNVRKPDDAQQLYRKIQEEREEKKRRLGRPNRIPQQVALNLDEHVPTLMEVEVEEERKLPAQKKSRQTEKVSAKRREPAAVQDELLGDPLAFDDDDRIEPQLTSDFDQDEQPVEEAESRSPVESGIAPGHVASPGSSASALREFEPDMDAGYDSDEDYLEEDNEHRDEEIDEDDESSEPFREPEDVLVINVMAPKGQRFHGDLLLETVLECGMRFGSMNIFHHHEFANGEGGVLYSMANIVVPGTFDLAAMKDDFTTPGVSLFLALPVDADSSKAFETMLKTAKAIAARLHGELKDEHRSVMTAQTIEHYRSRIKEFERKQLSRPV